MKTIPSTSLLDNSWLRFRTSGKGHYRLQGK
jgi:hypothetical protein